MTRGQLTIAGAEEISTRELLERRGRQPLRAAVLQKPADVGIFDTGARAQTDLLDLVTKGGEA